MGGSESAKITVEEAGEGRTGIDPWQGTQPAEETQALEQLPNPCGNARNTAAL